LLATVYQPEEKEPFNYNLTAEGQWAMGNKHSKKNRSFKKLLMIILCITTLVIFISGCSSSSNDSEQPTSNYNWDEMVWDQGNWE